MTSNENQVSEHESTEEQDAEQTPTNKTFQNHLYDVLPRSDGAIPLGLASPNPVQTITIGKPTFLMRNGEAKQAIEAYQKAIKNKARTLFFTKEPSVYNNLGQAYLYDGQYAPAVEHFKLVIVMAPDIAEGYVNLTTAYLRQNLPTDAREICLHALQTFPKTALLHYNLSCAYALEGASQNR